MKNLRGHLRLYIPSSKLTLIINQPKLQQLWNILTQSLKTCLEIKCCPLISFLRPQHSGLPSGSNRSNSRDSNLFLFITSQISRLIVRSVIIVKSFKKSKNSMIYWKCKSVSYLLVNRIKSKLNELQLKDQ